MIGRRRGATLLTLALGLLGARAHAQPAVAPPPPPTRTEVRQLRLFTWNVGTCNPLSFRLPEKAVPRVIETIGRARPDVITLQEVASPAQAAQIASALSAHGLTLRTAEMVVDARRSDGRLAVTYYQGEGEVLRHRTSNGFGILGLRQRGVTVINIHAPIAALDRAPFFAELAEWTRSLGGPVIVQGDYNCGPFQGAGLAMVYKRDRKHDLFSYFRFLRALPVGTRPEATNLFGLAIDHVRLNAGRVLSQKVHRKRRIFPMDHDPLEAEVQVEVQVAEDPPLQAQVGMLEAMRIAPASGR